ncbi:MAG: DNA internalization-related competence protein ComEC/Rec2 [Nitrospirae bacterium]|nr:DNA internalization-related competence protein ComEC/Rec2 [Nitrospirota bacterium]
MKWFLSFVFGVLLFHGKLYFPASAAIATLGILALFLFKKNLPLNLFIFITAGFLYAWFRHEPIELFPPESLIVTGVFTSLPVKVEHHSFRKYAAPSFQQDFEISAPSPGGLFKKPVSLFYSHPGDGFMPGTEAGLLVRLKTYRPPQIPGSYSFDTRLTGSVKRILSLKQSESLRWFFQRQRYHLARYFDAAFTRETSGVLKSITIGDISGISGSVRENFRVTGLTHLLSISGTHFGMLTVLVFGICTFIVSRIPHRLLLAMTIRISTKQLAALLTIPIVAAYLLISGMSVPALRSFIMNGLFLVGLILCRKGQWKNTLALAACICELIDPESIFSAQFQLSFLSCLFIGLASDRFGYHFTEHEKPQDMNIPAFYVIDKFFAHIRELDSKIYTYAGRIFSYLRDMVIVSLAATLGTMPVILYAFHSTSTVSILANMIVVPYMCLVITPIILFSSFIYLISGYFPFAGIIGLLTKNMLDVIDYFARVPYSSINIKAFPFIFVIISYVILMCFFLRKTKLLGVTAAAAACLVVFYYYTRAPNTLSVTFLDVGQGDSTLVETPNGKAIAIDTGGNGSLLEGYLRYRGKHTLDAMILSHGDSDHIGGLSNILSKFDVKYLLDNGFIAYSTADMAHFRGKHVILRRGDILNIDNITLAVLHPPGELEGPGLLSGKSSNNTSLVIKITGAHTSFLFTGDIETEGEEAITGLKEKLRSEVLKVSHHGSRMATAREFISYVHPSVAVISVGRGNSFGHPTQDVLDNLHGIPVYRTDRQGAILVSETQRGFKVKTQFDYELIKTISFGEELKNLKRILSVW